MVVLPPAPVHHPYLGSDTLMVSLVSGTRGLFPARDTFWHSHTESFLQKGFRNGAGPVVFHYVVNVMLPKAMAKEFVQFEIFLHKGVKFACVSIVCRLVNRRGVPLPVPVWQI